MNGIPFGITDWQRIAPTERVGEAGVARWRTQEFGAIRVRLVEYSAGYRADHWCRRVTFSTVLPAGSRPSWLMAAFFGYSPG